MKPDADPAARPVSVLLAAHDMNGRVLRIMYPAFQDPPRFQVISVAASWEDLQADMATYRPEAVVVDAGLAPDPEGLRDYLARLVGTIAVVVLPLEWEARRGLFEGAQTSVRAVFSAPPKWEEVAKRTYSAAITERSRAASAEPVGAALRAAAPPDRPGQYVIGTRSIAFLSFAGGTGKSTIAETLAVEFARHRIRTLLCSFNSPPAAVGHLGVRLAPSASEWLKHPTTEGFQASLQHPRGLEDLDVLVAPNEPQAYAEAAARRAEDPASVMNLVFSAYALHYGAILLDLPPFADSMWAVQALFAANTAVLVCRPTVHDQLAAMRAYELLTRQWVAQVRVPPEAIFAVLNFVSPKDNLSERDFHAAICKEIGRFPPILASFPFVPEMPAVQNRADSPSLAPECGAFAKVGVALGGKLIGGTLKAPSDGRAEDKGRFRIELKFPRR